MTTDKDIYANANDIAMSSLSILYPNPNLDVTGNLAFKPKSIPLDKTSRAQCFISSHLSRFATQLTLNKNGTIKNDTIKKVTIKKSDNQQNANSKRNAEYNQPHKNRFNKNITSQKDNDDQHITDVNATDKFSLLSAHSEVRLSFQLMTRAEPADMVIATIRSLLAIKEPEDEILIVDNNHTDTSLYTPLAKFCAGLDASLKVRFYHVDVVAGFKAGALNLALGLMDPDCTHIVVVDSDYQALPQARTAIAQAIQHYPTHSLLQFPQFYRDAHLSDVHSELNHYFNYHLYRPFNRMRALSTGTYAVIRRQALLNLGGWSGASLTEDAQMGVLMHYQGLRSQYIPRVIANGLLPTSIHDLIAQRCRWIYGNMQVINGYFSIASSQQLKPNQTKLERLAYWRAHFSQLTAWLNFTGLFIVLHACTLLIIAALMLTGANINPEPLQLSLYVVYTSYGIFLLRRLQAYIRDKAPLNQQIKGAAPSRLSQRLRAWAMHLNFWELGALSWLPVLWGRDKPFVCTPKQATVSTPRALWLANIRAVPKLLFVLSALTALVTAPFSVFYSPLLFISAVVLCALKLASAHVILSNYAYTEPETRAAIDFNEAYHSNRRSSNYRGQNPKIPLTRTPSTHTPSTRTQSITTSSSAQPPRTVHSAAFEDDNAVNF